MAKNLVIVESPAKAKTIHKILGHDFDVTFSMGHVVDLPASRLGVDVEHNFEPHYIVIRKRGKIAKQLKLEAKGKEAIYLAPDPDREGEAISWHLAKLLHDEALKEAQRHARTKSSKAKSSAKSTRAARAQANGQKIYRITFHEITPQAVKAAIQHPGKIDLNKVNAQQARRILDRLVGYSLSPLLWKKIGRGLSAGRVQSVALRLIVDREREIEAFVPHEYWSIDAQLQKPGDEVAFKAQLDQIRGKKIAIVTKDEAERVTTQLRKQAFVVVSVDEKEQRRYPKPPFTTSTLQQVAFHRLGFSSARTMRIAQQLYEGLEIGEAGPVGLITYMRTDAVRVSAESLAAVRELIGSAFGASFLPQESRTYKAKKSAQEAHEAVRPTSVARTPESIKSFLNEEQWNLYQLIWQRFVASQMADAVDRVTSVKIEAGLPAAPTNMRQLEKHRTAAQAGPFQLKANGRTPVFAGWTQVYREPDEKEPEDGALPEGILPPLTTGDALTLVACVPSQHFTKPPRRYTDASLVKALEEQGIGRPSTYAPILHTIVSRDYVQRAGGSLVPTKLGRVVIDLLIEHFPDVLDLKFTADMEEELDRIEEGHVEWVGVVRNFYTPFSKRVITAQEKMREVKREVIPTEHVCEKCSKPMVIKWGRFGQFLSCSGFPECKNAKPVPTGVACSREGCGGELIQRRARGRIFYGCSNYPTCTHTERKLPAPPGESN